MKTQADDVKKRIEAFSDACLLHDIKATHQRSEIYRELARSAEHPDAETIYRRVRRRIPAISLDTIYRTLRLLEEKGIISRVGVDQRRTRFDANVEPHHHFVCTRCGLLSDFSSAEMDNLPAPRALAAVGSVDSVHVEMRGVCQACRKKKPGRR